MTTSQINWLIYKWRKTSNCSSNS